MTVPLIGLTGGMGAGKSTALAALQRLGATVLSSDQIVHELYETPQVRDAVVQRWGEQVAPGQVVDRGLIAGIVFGSEAERQWLEDLLWPLVGARVQGWLSEVQRLDPPPRAAVLEVPLLFEAGFERSCDATVAIVADPQTISARTRDRAHVAVAARNGRQLSQEEKAELATFVVVNEGTEQELQEKLSEVLAKLGR
jgi:dephospho-CoA kinase